MSRWVAMGAAAAELRKSPRSIRRWRDREVAPPCALFDPPEGKVKAIDVEGLTWWASGQGLLEHSQEDGRPTDLEVLTREEVAPPAYIAPEQSAAAVAKVEGLTIEEVAALRAAGLDDDAIARASLDPRLLKRAGAAARTRKDEADAKKKETENLQRAGKLVHISDVMNAFQKQATMVHNSRTWFPGKVADGVRERARAVAQGLPEETRDAFLGMVYDATHEVTTEALHDMLKRFSLETRKV